MNKEEIKKRLSVLKINRVDKETIAEFIFKNILNHKKEKNYIPICINKFNKPTAEEIGKEILKLLEENKKNKLEYLYLKIYENTISPDLFNN